LSLTAQPVPLTRTARAATLALIIAVAGCRSSSKPGPSGTASPLANTDATPTTATTASLAFSPAIVELEAPLGTRQFRDVRLVGRWASRARLAISHVDDPALDVHVLPPDRSGAAGVRLTFTGDRAGVRTGQVVVTTGLSQPADLTLLYRLRVPSAVTVTPSNPYFDLRDPNGRARRLEVRGHGPDFRITGADVVAGPFRATVESDGAGSGGVAAIRVSVDQAKLASSPQRGFLGKLRIRANEPTQPTTDVPLLALGALGKAPSAPDAGGHGVTPTQ
jgi:hypothetical protein